jgi:hypothetical protein
MGAGNRASHVFLRREEEGSLIYTPQATRCFFSTTGRG